MIFPNRAYIEIISSILKWAKTCQTVSKRPNGKPAFDEQGENKVEKNIVVLGNAGKQGKSE